MEWLTTIKETLKYIENNLLTIEGMEDVARHVGVSPLYMQQGFQVLTGYGVTEYIRKRRLYLASLELMDGDSNVLDVALKYGYQTPESFSKAFSRFHGASPADVKKGKAVGKKFYPLKIYLQIQGGNSMEFKVGSMQAFKVIGEVRKFNAETSYKEIPEFWDEFMGKNVGDNVPAEIAKAMNDNAIGELGICFSHECGETFDYMIGGFYRGGEVPKGFEVREMPQMLWAKFRCYGAIPEALQSVNTQIWREWLPGNSEYEFAGNFDVEWYSAGDPSSPEYISEIWLPVKKI